MAAAGRAQLLPRPCCTAGNLLLLLGLPAPQLAEFNPLDADSIAGVLKRGSRVVLVVGDQVRERVIAEVLGPSCGCCC